MHFDSGDTIAALRVWDVVWPHDELIYPPSWKMWVCVSTAYLWFLRINSAAITEPVLHLSRALHPFLERDSWLGCGGDLIQVAEVELEDALRRQGHPARRGRVGCIHPDCRTGALDCIKESARLAPRQVRVILAECT